MFQQIIKRQSLGSNSKRPSFNRRLNTQNESNEVNQSHSSSKSSKERMLGQILSKNTATPRLKAYLDHYQIFRQEPDQQQVILRVKTNYNISCKTQATDNRKDQFVMMKELKIDNYYDLKRVIENLQLQKDLTHENLLSLIWYQLRSQVKPIDRGQFRRGQFRRGNIGNMNNQTRAKQTQRVKYKNLRQQQQHQREIHIITLFYQYFPVTIQQQIYNRTVQARYFEQFEIWSLLYSCVSGLAYLQKKNICHSSVSDFDIFLTEDGFVKIIDPSIATYAPLQQYAEGFYYSPQLLDIYKKRGIQRGIIGYTSSVNISKADVYSLGMVIMQACLLQNCSDCYNYAEFMVEGHILKQKFNTLTKYYSTKLLDIIYNMINFNPEKRPNFQQLQSMIVSVLELPKQNFMINSIQSLQLNIQQSKQGLTKGSQTKTDRLQTQGTQEKRSNKSKQQVQGCNKKTQNKVISHLPCAPLMSDEQDILPVDSLANEYGIDMQKINPMDFKDARKQVYESIKDSFIMQIRKFQNSLRKKIASQKSVQLSSKQPNHNLKDENIVSQFGFHEESQKQQIIAGENLIDNQRVFNTQQKQKKQTFTKEQVKCDKNQIKIVIIPPKQQQLRKTQKKQFQVNLNDNNCLDLRKTQQFTCFKKPLLDKKPINAINENAKDQYLQKRLQQIKQQSYYRYLPQDVPFQQKIKQQFAVSIDFTKKNDQNLKQSACTNPQFLKMITDEIQRIKGRRKQIQTKLSVLR